MGRGSDRQRRAATAVWLARVASNRPGVVQRVVRRCGSLDAALDASLPALRACLAPKATAPSGPAAAAPSGRATAAPSGPLAPATTSRRAATGETRGQAAEAAREASRFVSALSASLEPPKGASHDGWLLVTYDDELYPARLRTTFDPPPALFVAGHEAERRLGALAAAPAVAVVGTRAPSAYGREMARLIGGDLARAGVVVVSGVALGIDVCAQLAALEAAGDPALGVPPSVGVLGCGLDIVHPRSNAAAFRALRERGLLVTEFWPGTPPSVWRFPARNRVIAGLSQAVVVVEGSRRSGSRITAGLAVEASREVFAVPGEAGRRLSEAPHHLLKQGAHLCEAADDVLAVLGLERTYEGSRCARGTEKAGPELQAGEPSAASDAGAGAAGEAAARRSAGVGGADLAADARAVLRALEDAPGTAEDLAARAGLDVRVVTAALSALEVEGLAESAPGGVYRGTR
ncbi:MAG: DNA-processing protein DprA [Solirubrobacteraceae bacterium]|nr:DNA-processing protein DprA [Solirubrobacteraceae bacterium]